MPVHAIIRGIDLMTSQHRATYRAATGCNVFGIAEGSTDGRIEAVRVGLAWPLWSADSRRLARPVGGSTVLARVGAQRSTSRGSSPADRGFDLRASRTVTGKFCRVDIDGRRHVEKSGQGGDALPTAHQDLCFGAFSFVFSLNSTSIWRLMV